MEAMRLRLRVSPGATRTGIVGRHGDAWKIRVSAPPEAGRANDAVVRLLADALSVSTDAVTVVSGRRGRDKIVELTGVDPSRVEQCLGAAAGKEQS